MDIKPNATPDTRSPKLQKNLPRKKMWVFSFQYFKQIDLFGASTIKANWFASFLERISDLSKMGIDDILESPQWMEAFRYHPIDWSRKNVPITRQSLNWLPSDYRDNEDDFPLVQFQLSKGTGRCVGFFDEHSVFNLVLIDPEHNIQPAKKYDYRVTPCFPLDSLYENLRKQIQEIRCTLPGKFDGIDEHAHKSSWFSVVYLEDHLVERAENLVERGYTPQDIFELGLDELK